MNLPEASWPAIQALVERALKEEKDNRENEPPMSAFCLAQLLSASSFEDKRRILRMIRICSGAPRYGYLMRMVMRSAMIDSMVDSFIAGHPGCPVVDLGCGFDTRYWRIDAGACAYFEVDVPEIVDLKRELLRDFIAYELIGRSVLDPAWMDAVADRRNEGCLFIAEGLFSRMTEGDAVRLLRMLGTRFSNSRVVLDAANRTFTEALLEKLNSRGVSPTTEAGAARDDPAGTWFRLVSVARTGRSGTVLLVGLRENGGA